MLFSVMSWKPDVKVSMSNLKPTSKSIPILLSAAMERTLKASTIQQTPVRTTSETVGILAPNANTVR